MLVTEVSRKNSEGRGKKTIKHDRQIIASPIALKNSPSPPHRFSTLFFPMPIFQLIEASVNSRHNRLG
ncbi:hypothetical protein QUA71_11045 [Microcoleus sp. MON1_C5]|uniref:hypothetical protein n=1 Tax=Microcoleus sp. MON1_C5 TaxID=2818828 RepID=UPI002FCF4193